MLMSLKSNIMYLEYKTHDECVLSFVGHVANNRKCAYKHASFLISVEKL